MGEAAPFARTAEFVEADQQICPTGKSVRLRAFVCPAPFAKIF
jgi:hypothetical protein